jgi:quercetin dioxygenase-like cupin family protein
MKSNTTGGIMSTTPQDALAPVSQAHNEGEHIWFFGGLTTIKADGKRTGGRVMVTEQLMLRGGGSPLHVHHNEDEWFYVLEGQLTFWVGGETVVAEAGAFLYGPRDVPHTFVVSSDRARFMLVTEPAGMEGFIRALGTPAAAAELPTTPTPPPDMDRVMRAAADYGLDILGPPGIPADS